LVDAQDSSKLMRVIAEQDQSVSTDDVNGSPTVRLGRDADRFVGLPIAQAALEFASARHASQYREIDHAPFIIHPIEVGRLLDRDGHPDDVIAAGLLHDTLERTATTSAELKRRFGVRIGRLVESVSDDQSIGDYVARKRELRDRVSRSDADTVAIFAADKISKVRELTLLPPSRLHVTATRAPGSRPVGRPGGFHPFRSMRCCAVASIVAPHAIVDRSPKENTMSAVGADTHQTLPASRQAAFDPAGSADHRVGDRVRGRRGT
jgi:HD domain